MSFRKIKWEKEKIIVWLGAFLLALAFYGMFMQVNYSPDSYLLQGEREWPTFHSLANGRPFGELVMGTLFHTGFYPVEHQTLFSFLQILVFSSGITLFYQIANKRIDSTTLVAKLLLFGASGVPFLNFCFWEWFYYPETMPSFTLALLFLILAILFYERRIYIPAFLCLFVGMGHTQAVMGFFLATAFWIVLLDYMTDRDSLKSAFLRGLWTTALTGAVAFINVLLPRLAVKIGLIEETARPVSFSKELLLTNLQGIRATIRQFYIGGYQHFPKYFLLFFWLVALALLVISFLPTLRKEWGKLVLAIFVGLLAIVTPLLIFAAAVYFWPAPRTIIGMFCSSSFILMTALIQFERSTFQWKQGKLVLQLIVSIALVAFFSVDYLHVHKETIDLMNTNELDYYLAQQIEYEIEKYEEESGNTVSLIKLHNDARGQSHYPHVTTEAYDTNMSTLVVKWSLNGFFRYIADRDYQFDMMADEEYQQYFTNQDWAYFIPDEEIVFAEDVAYLVLP